MTAVTNIDPNANTQPITTSALDLLVGTDKKFTTVEALAEGKLKSDQFIEKLTSELHTLRSVVADQDKRLAKAEAASSILDRLDTSSITSNQTSTQQPPVVTPTAPGLTEDDVIKTIERRETASVQANNRRQVDAVLSKQLGANAGPFLLQKAAELGMDPKYLNNLAATSPSAFYAVIGIDPNESETSSTYNPTRRGPTNIKAEIRNKAWYDAKQREMGTKKFVMDRKLQLDMHKDMEVLGDAFFD